MGVYKVVGQRLISERDLLRKGSAISNLVLGHKEEALTLPAGEFTAADFAPAAGPATPGFQPVGPGKPLMVEMRHLYTGRYPDTIFNSANMLVTSSIKNLDIFDASAEAVNFLMPKQSSRKDYIAPPADQNGTPIVCYIPAVTALKTIITFNLIFQRFDDSILTEINSIFSSAASIPLFFSAAPYLLGANAVLKLAGDAADAIFNGTPNYNPTFVLNFGDPGEPLAASGFTVLFKNEDDTSADPDKMTFDPQKGLIDPNTKAAYKGPAPYIVISIDGTAQSSLSKFTPTAASAAILANFFNIRDGGTVPVSDIVDALKALNDVKYRGQADKLQEEINNTPAGPDQDALKKQLAAVVANIQNQELKPKSS